MWSSIRLGGLGVKRISFSILNLHGIEFMLLPTIGFKVVDRFYKKDIHLAFAWLCFGVSIKLKTTEYKE